MTPAGEVTGLLIGERHFKQVGKCYAVERSRLLWGEVSLGNEKKNVYPADHKLVASELVGGLYKVTPEFIAKFNSTKLKHKFEGLTHKDKF